MIHMLLAPVHVHHPYTFRGQYSYVVTFHTDPTELDRPSASEKKALLTQSLARRLIDPQVRHPVSLSTQPLKM
jgi:hypothetical protein